MKCERWIWLIIFVKSVAQGCCVFELKTHLTIEVGEMTSTVTAIAATMATATAIEASTSRVI